MHIYILYHKLRCYKTLKKIEHVIHVKKNM